MACASDGSHFRVPRDALIGSGSYFLRLVVGFGRASASTASFAGEARIASSASNFGTVMSVPIGNLLGVQQRSSRAHMPLG